MNLEKTITQIESEDPAIGIGTATGVAGILAASLVLKIANKSRLEEVKKECEKVKKNLTKLIKEDTKAYEAYMKAYKAKDEKKIKKALEYAIVTPIKIAEQSYRVMELAQTALEYGKKSMALEACGAAHLGRAAILSTLEIIELNLKELKDDEYGEKIRIKKYDLDRASYQKEAEILAEAMPYIYDK